MRTTDIDHCLFLTVNSRLSRHLLKTLDNQYSATSSVWQTPHVLPLPTWLTQQFHRYNLSGKVLLSDFQEQCLWEKIIQEDDNAPALLQAAQTARLIKEAWRFLIEWEVPLATLSDYAAQCEVQCLIGWINAFKKTCQKHNWITHSQLPSTLAAIDQQSTISLPRKILLAGFDDIPPSTQTLFDQLSARVDIEHFHNELPQTTCHKISLTDSQEELVTMANWAKQCWQANPTHQIACIIPDLQNQKALVRRVFTQVFCIENLLPSGNHTIAPFNVSAGESFDQHDMIKTALIALQWSCEPIPMQHVGYLLQSPYLCQSESESSMGALLDATLRKSQQLMIHPNDLFVAMTKLQTAYPESNWLSRWRNWLSVAKNQEEQRPPSQWTLHFIELLKALKWPGQQTQGSESFQYLERFKKLLSEFSQLDLIYKTMSFKHALKLLTTSIKQTVYQPKSHQEPIQVMGILEASGLTFDALWVMGLHNGVWPAPTKPNPFIPFSIQQKYQLPHATAARELSFSKQVTHRLKKSAQQVVFSIPLQQDDQELQPSQLLYDIPDITRDALPITLSTTQWDQAPLEIIKDDIAPPIDHPAAIKGGTQILKLQAECPFKAFAMIRLQAVRLDAPQLGLDGATQGSLVHEILFLLWEQIKDQTQLNQLSDDALADHIERAIEKAASQYKTQEIKQKNQFFWAIEKERLKKLLMKWMTLEKDRPYFQVVQRETAAQIQIHHLSLQLRIDRVDQLGDGSYLLIDYKTGGDNSINQWFKDRLTAPQLPLYAAFTQPTDQHTYTGLAFAQVSSYQVSFQGVVSENHIYTTTSTPGFTPIHLSKNNLSIFQWAGLQKHWEMRLTQLAKDFCDGIATVDPESTSVCQHCDLQTLCRINTWRE